eukprot:1442049-Amphidinium_carterae.2
MCSEEHCGAARWVHQTSTASARKGFVSSMGCRFWTLGSQNYMESENHWIASRACAKTHRMCKMHQTSTGSARNVLRGSTNVYRACVHVFKLVTATITERQQARKVRRRTGGDAARKVHQTSTGSARNVLHVYRAYDNVITLVTATSTAR